MADNLSFSSCFQFHFLKEVCVDLQQSLKSKYEASLDFEASNDGSYSVVVKGCTLSNLPAIESEIATISALIQMHKVQTSYLPGLASLFTNKQSNGIQAALEKAQSK